MRWRYRGRGSDRSTSPPHHPARGSISRFGKQNQAGPGIAPAGRWIALSPRFVRIGRSGRANELAFLRGWAVFPRRLSVHRKSTHSIQPCFRAGVYFRYPRPLPSRWPGPVYGVSVKVKIAADCALALAASVGATSQRDRHRRRQAAEHAYMILDLLAH